MHNHTKATLILTGFFLLGFFITSVSAGETSRNTEVTLEQGFLDITTIAGVDTEGVGDSTSGLNRALSKAMRMNKVAYFPPGTYLVSNTLLGEYKSSDTRCGGSHNGANTAVLVGSKAGARRPVIKLKDNAAGFQNSSSPRPVVLLRHLVSSGEAQADCTFGFGFRNIDIDLGKSNEGAVGLHFDAAQDSFVEDVRIQARDGFAGITALPGRSAANQNIEIVGGQYGLYLKGTSLGATLVGLVLKGQKQQAIVSSVFRGLSITGFNIQARKGPVIILQGGSAESSNIGLFDGAITLNNPGQAINNARERYLVMRNVYFKRASTIVESGDKRFAGNANGWSRVKYYSYCPESLTGTVNTCWNLNDGLRNRKNFADAVHVNWAPAKTLVSRHVWSGPPAYEDSRVIRVTEHGATPDDGKDDTKAIQEAIDTAAHRGGNAVFLPAGVYDTTAPIVLKAKTQLFGVPGRRSILRAMDSWRPSQRTWIVETVNDSNASSTIEHVVTNWRNRRNVWFGALHWRAGKKSVVRQIRAEARPGRWEDTARHIYRIDGGGGGRWFSFTDHMSIERPSIRRHDQDFRKLVISGTHQPLTFYGLNVEHGGSPQKVVNGPFVEIENARNVRLLGMKAETNGNVMKISDSNNIFVGVAFANPRLPGHDLLRLERSSNVEMNLVAWGKGHESDEVVNEVGYGAAQVVSRKAMLGAFSRGKLNWNAWPARF